MTAPIEVTVMRLAGGDGLPLPAYATPGAAGLDLAAAVSEAVVIPPGGRAVVPTGIAIALPVGFEAQVRPRSGLAARAGVTVLNAPGTVDSDYRGEIQVILANFGDAPFKVARGERIAQLIVAPVTRLSWRSAEQLPDSARGAGGFGSTGTGTKE
jgi:dUTP pyrophosphatase